MEPIIVTSDAQIRRVVAEALHQTLPGVLSILKSTSDGPKEWLTNKEAMGFLGLSKTTLQRYRTEGRLPFSKAASHCASPGPSVPQAEVTTSSFGPSILLQSRAKMLSR